VLCESVAEGYQNPFRGIEKRFSAKEIYRFFQSKTVHPGDFAAFGLNSNIRFDLQCWWKHIFQNRADRRYIVM